MPNITQPLDAAVASFGISADADLSVVQTNMFSTDIIPSRYVQFEVEPYRVVQGMPFKEGNYGFGVLVECGINSVSNPSPSENDALNLGFSGHWVSSTPDMYVSGETWYPVKGDPNVSLISSTGNIPELINFDYLRKRAYVSSTVMSLDSGAHFVTPNLSWNTEVSFVCTFIPRVPIGSEFVVMETNLSEEDYGREVNGSFISIRYNTLGQILFVAGDDVLWRSNTVYGYLSRPLIIGLNIDATNQTVRLAVIDNSKIQFVNYNIEHPFEGCFYLGYSPADVLSNATMNILDVAYWNKSLLDSEFDNHVLRINQQYGVTL
jgi:hypothetical protein